MIWLYRRFGRVSYLRKANGIWEQGDLYIARLNGLGTKLHESFSSEPSSADQSDRIIAEINRVNEEITPLEDGFSQTLGEAARWVQRVLIELLTGGGALLILAGFATCFRLLKRIQESERNMGA